MKNKFAIAIHGGAGTILKKNMPAALEKQYLAKLRESLSAGYNMLENKGTAVDPIAAAIKILDYFHCKKYLCHYAQLAIKDLRKREKWIKEQEDLLFEDRVQAVIENIKKNKGLNEEAQCYRLKILTYYKNNKSKMLYGSYKKLGLLIGSGPIESAHRNVIQKRLKLSGQRWSKQGVQQIANLRVVHKNNDWDKVVELITKKAT